MKYSGRLVLTLAISTLFSCICEFANAQELSCDNLKQIVKIVAEDSTLTSIKGAKIENIQYEKRYLASIPLWDKADGMVSQYIKYDVERHNYVYHAFEETEGTSGKNLAQATAKSYKNCLGTDWVLKGDANGLDDSVFYLKNPVNYVVIKIEGSGGSVSTDFYNGSKEGDKCIYGDCDFYFGGRHFFNEDTYSGTFIDEGLNGVGRINWYSLKMAYQGSFIDDQIAGYGTMYDDNNKVLSTGIYFKGAAVQVDTTQKTCQYGDCQTGFGLKVIPRGVYIGNFKDGLYEGLGEMITTKTAFYGHFVKNQINGKGIFINPSGDYTFATYVNGRPTGNYEQDYADKTTKEANVADGSGSLFDEDNILNKSGVWSQAGFKEYTDAAYLDIKAFAKSIKGFYGYRNTAYKGIRGEQSKRLQILGIEFYKSTLLFLNAFETNISGDRKNVFSIKINLSGKSMDKLKNIALYNKYYDSLNKSVGRRWTTTIDDGHASAAKGSASVVLENMFDRSKFISLSVDPKSGVNMEIH